MFTAVAIARASRGSTIVPGSTQVEARQGAAAASEAGLGFSAAEGVQGEAEKGAAAASEDGLSVAAAEGAGMAARTS